MPSAPALAKNGSEGWQVTPLMASSKCLRWTAPISWIRVLLSRLQNRSDPSWPRGIQGVMEWYSTTSENQLQYRRKTTHLQRSDTGQVDRWPVQTPNPCGQWCSQSFYLWTTIIHNKDIIQWIKYTRKHAEGLDRSAQFTHTHHTPAYWVTG